MPLLSRHRFLATLAAPVAALTLAGPAGAADAPSRYVGFNLDGSQGAATELHAIARDASEVLLTVNPSRADGAPVPVIRDVRAGTTTRLLRPGLAATVFGASEDLGRVLFVTGTALDPADANTTADAYVIDRRTGTIKLASRQTTGGPAVGTLAPDYPSVTAAISGDGRRVLYGATVDGRRQVLTHELDTGVVGRLADGEIAGPQVISRNGFTFMSPTGVVSPRASVTVPNWRRAFLAPQGAVAIYETTDAPGEVQLVNTLTGAVRKVRMPAGWDPDTVYPEIHGVSDTGRYVQAGLLTPELDGRRQYVRWDTTTGAVAPLGGPVKEPTALGEPLLTPDGAFAADARRVFALGAAPIPGSPVAVPPIPAVEWVTFYPGCSDGGWQAPRISPAVKPVWSAPLGETPSSKATSTYVRITAGRGTTEVLGEYTLKGPNERQNLPTGFGNFTWLIRVTLEDGSTSEQTGYMASYTPVRNSWPGIWPVSYTACGRENEL